MTAASLGLFCAVVIVMRIAIWARHQHPEPTPAPEPTPVYVGRHRQDSVPAALRHLAAVPDLPAGTPLPAEDYEYDVDDWTADLPTAALPVARVHTSPSEEARRRWRTETPIFAALAHEQGFDLTELVAA